MKNREILCSSIMLIVQQVQFCRLKLVLVISNFNVS